MKFKFIGNAGGIFIGSNGTKILCVVSLSTIKDKII